jgi:hypothetical protein
MRGITIATVAAFAAVILTSAIIGSGHIALTYNNKVIGKFSNTGNNRETQQPVVIRANPS